MPQESANLDILDAPPQLNPALDRAKLAQEFLQPGRIQIQQVLTRDSAQRIYRCLAEETSYNLIFNNGEEQLEYVDLTSQQRQEYTKSAWRRVGLDGFQFLYEQHILSKNGEVYRDPTHYWAKVTTFLNSVEFLDLVRDVTGIQDIALADGQASLYRAGHFLTSHGDISKVVKRRVAYVLSLTARWRAEWGGLLEFIDGAGHIEAGYVPNFNSLRLFRVPMNHYVSCVAPYAMSGRYSITGWLRAE